MIHKYGTQHSLTKLVINTRSELPPELGNFQKTYTFLCKNIFSEVRFFGPPIVVEYSNHLFNFGHLKCMLFGASYRSPYR